MAGRTDSAPESSKLTYEDYVTLPDDGRRYEILDGELAVSPSPTSTHQLVSQNLEFALSAWVRAQRLGRIWHAPLDLILEPTVVTQPDIFFISNARSSIVTKRGVEGAPDMVIEIHTLRALAYELIATYSGNELAQLDVPHGFVLALAEI